MGKTLEAWQKYVTSWSEGKRYLVVGRALEGCPEIIFDMIPGIGHWGVIDPMGDKLYECVATEKVGKSRAREAQFECNDVSKHDMCTLVVLGVIKEKPEKVERRLMLLCQLSPRKYDLLEQNCQDWVEVAIGAGCLKRDVEAMKGEAIAEFGKELGVKHGAKLLDFVRMVAEEPKLGFGLAFAAMSIPMFAMLYKWCCPDEKHAMRPRPGMSLR